MTYEEKVKKGMALIPLVNAEFDNPVDCLQAMAIMTASLCKTIEITGTGYTASSAACMAIDVMLYTIKELKNMPPLEGPKPSPASYV